MLKVGDVAPGFELSNEKGVSLRLLDRLALSSPLLVVFYKFNCPTCQYTFQYLPRIAREVGEEYFLAIAQDTLNEAAQFKAKYGFNFEVVCDLHPYKVSVAQYGISFVPTFFVIEKDLRISEVAEGFDKKCIENFAVRIASIKSMGSYAAFRPTDQVPLLKPG